MVSKIEPDRYAITGFSIKDTPQELNDHLFQKMMEKTGADRLAIGCQMNDTARQLVWSGIPKNLPEEERKAIFLKRFYGHNADSAFRSYDTLSHCLRFQSPKIYQIERRNQGA